MYLHVLVCIKEIAGMFFINSINMADSKIRDKDGKKLGGKEVIKKKTTC